MITAMGNSFTQIIVQLLYFRNLSWLSTINYLLQTFGNSARHRVGHGGRGYGRSGYGFDRGGHGFDRRGHGLGRDGYGYNRVGGGYGHGGQSRDGRNSGRSYGYNERGGWGHHAT